MKTPNFEQMTRQELRVFLQEWFCGCGSPEKAAGALLKLLSLHPLYDHREAFKAAVPDDGMEMLLLYALDSFGLTGHGGTVEGGWLTDKGKAVSAALKREEVDGFETLVVMSCCHGYAIDVPVKRPEIVDCAECHALNP